uniref:Pecanex-like protein n=1 Tax=Gongylonema pulchrum TaxID=637853 RepID=A0A183CWI5_9BILA
LRIIQHTFSSSHQKPSDQDRGNDGATSEAVSTLSTDNDQTKQSFFFNDNIVGQKYMEPSRLPGSTHVRGTQIVWERTQTVLELPILGHFRTYEKRADRARPNPWRRHGALMKIHEIGGWISKLEKQPVSRRNRKYYYVKPGSKACNAPTRPPIMIRESKFLPASAVSIPDIRLQNVEELAYTTAIQIQEAIQAVVLDSHANTHTKSRGSKDDNSDNRSTRTDSSTTVTKRNSSAIQRLPVQEPARNTTRSRSLGGLANRRKR